jgi:hypothetical protein
MQKRGEGIAGLEGALPIEAGAMLYRSIVGIYPCAFPTYTKCFCTSENFLVAFPHGGL